MSSVHQGYSAADVRAATGFDYDEPAVTPQTKAPRAENLALLRGRVPLVLVANGARAWELAVLRRRLPEAPLFTLRRLPATSVEHGDVISLLIEHHRGPFGIVDHDCYLFDADLLGHLMPAPDECMVALVADRHPHLNFELPLTHLGLVLDEARRNGAPMPVTALVDQFYGDVQRLGGGRWDTSSLIRRLK